MLTKNDKKNLGVAILLVLLGILGFLIPGSNHPEEPLRIPLELPKREPPPKVNWGNSCDNLTNLTIRCKAYRKEKAKNDLRNE